MGRYFIFVILLVPAISALENQERASALANPIRKVVTMLQSMQAKVQEEGEKELALYEKYMCYCKTAGGDLSESIASSGSSISDLGNKIKAAEEQKIVLGEELKTAQSDRTAAKQAMADATAVREKEAAAFAIEKSDADKDIAAVAKAIAAIEKGMAGLFLQTAGAQLLRTVILEKHDLLLEDDRQDLLSFLSNSEGQQYAPQSGQILGILKQMGDEMAKGLREATEAEESAIKAYEKLMAAKKKEVLVLTKEIETKLDRSGDLGVQIAQMKNDLGDTEESLAADKQFLANLEENCETKKKEWDVVVKTRAEELAAPADTIKVLNDDDALELFKKTLPGASASLMQTAVTFKALQMRALEEIRRAKSVTGVHHCPGLDFLALALSGKSALSQKNFDKVITMIDDMVAELKTEQKDDTDKLEYCKTELDLADDKKKSLERSVEDLEKAIAKAKEMIATLSDDIAALTQGIVDLDKSVVEATKNRKEENEAYKALMAADTAAKDLLVFAKNRLNKFYNPDLYVAPPKRELSAGDRMYENFGGELTTAAPGGIANTGIAVLAQVVGHDQSSVAPPPPPATWGAYSKKSEESTGVIGMIDLLIKDLDKEMTEATAEEKDGQSD